MLLTISFLLMASAAMNFFLLYLLDDSNKDRIKLIVQLNGWKAECLFHRKMVKTLQETTYVRADQQMQDDNGKPI